VVVTLTEIVGVIIIHMICSKHPRQEKVIKSMKVTSIINTDEFSVSVKLTNLNSDIYIFLLLCLGLYDVIELL